MERLVITVKEIRGTCPVYRVGDKIVLEQGYKFNLKETDNVCMHSLASILPYHIALYRGVDPRDIGLSKDPEVAYVQCLDPCEYTGGGTVVFEIRKKTGME
ncbi:MAG: TIGR04076 family protein [Deltaproteobacteria bacterium]|nr:MAG: TIGR04076 family protein [Deltaproteobacteria bacterium]RLB75532.1 MAG: TIGR04076 family protein [Deltaproteobacteria bacterium]